MKTRSNAYFLLVLGLALATAPGHAQTDGPLPIIRQATYGPGKDDQGGGSAEPYDFVQTPDGGFLIAGWAGGPANGIRTDPICALGDIWVIKIDAQGERQWDKSYGGDAGWGPGEVAYRIFLTPDGYLVAGLSMSEAGCLKTAPSLGSVYAWAVRCDANGNALWDKSYLPEAMDWYNALDYERTADGGYLACGWCALNNADYPYYGILKFDAQGQQLWSRTVDVRIGANYAYAIRETADGGCIVAGSSSSAPGREKTSPYYGGFYENNPSLGSDFWVVRLDAQRNKLWDKSYGGTGPEQAYGIHPLADGGFIVFGSSESYPTNVIRSGTKTSARYGLQDYWVVRIDAQGNQLWDRSYGGTSDDFCTCAEPMPDGGWLLSGQSGSIPSGNKTSPRFGASDFWIVRIDDQGNKLWDQTFGGSDLEGKVMRPWSPGYYVPARIRHTADGGFLLVGGSQSPADGVKTAPLISTYDYWVLKLGPEPPFLRGEVTAEGQFKLCLIGPPEFSHTIQGSADLATWTDLATINNPTGKAYWTDPDKLARRFYRAVRK